MTRVKPKQQLSSPSAGLGRGGGRHKKRKYRKILRKLRKIMPKPGGSGPTLGGAVRDRLRPMPGRPGPTTPGGRPIKPSEPSGGTRVRLPKPTPHYGPAKKRPPRMGPGFPGGGPIKPGGPKTRKPRNMPGPRPKGGKKIAEFSETRRRGRGRRRTR